jgi:hypothetical protein
MRRERSRKASRVYKTATMSGKPADPAIGKAVAE